MSFVKTSKKRLIVTVKSNCNLTTEFIYRFGTFVLSDR